MRHSLPLIPVPYFGMVLGLGGLGNGWRVAARVWSAPTFIGEVLALTAAAVWFLWFVLYALKWAHSPLAAISELIPICAEHHALAHSAPYRLRNPEWVILHADWYNNSN